MYDDLDTPRAHHAHGPAAGGWASRWQAQPPANGSMVATGALLLPSRTLHEPEL